MTDQLRPELIVSLPRFAFEGVWGRDVHCQLDVFRSAGGELFAVATELADNPGASVTNAAERLWHAVDQHLRPWGGSIRRFEHYPGHAAMPDTFHEVILRPGVPVWRTVSDPAALAVAAAVRDLESSRHTRRPSR